MFQNVPASSDGEGQGKPSPSTEIPYIHWCFRFTSSKCSSYKSIIISLEDLEVSAYVFQLEKGDGGVEHYQGYLKLKKKKRKKMIQKKLLEHFKELKFPKCDYLEVSRQVNNSKRYCMKDDTRLSGPWHCGIKDIDFRVLKPLPALSQDWQKEVFEYCKKEPKPREICYVNKKYGCGKSLLCNHLIREQDALVVDGSSKHILAVFYNENRKREIKIVVVDESADTKKTPFGAIEKLKNGFFCSAFGTEALGMCQFNIPHVIIFSNKHLEANIKNCKIDIERFKVWSDFIHMNFDEDLEDDTSSCDEG